MQGDSRQTATLVVSNLRRSVGGRLLHSGIGLTVRSGDILFVTGPSGVGKSLLLRSLAYLDPLDSDSGRLELNGRSPAEWGVPNWRARVCYVHQQRLTHAGTPSELYYTLQGFRSQRSRPRGDLPQTVRELGLEQSVLNQPWTQLSGGQAQRVQLAIALALRPLVLLLDEPTSALDADSTRRVERVVRASGAAVVWVSHDPQQPARVGGQVLTLPLGRLATVLTPPASPERTPPFLSPAAKLQPDLELSPSSERAQRLLSASPPSPQLSLDSAARLLPQ